MAERNPAMLVDGYVNFLGGVNMRHPSTILPNQFANAVNCTMRDGYPRNRPGFRKVDLVFKPITIEGDPDPEVIPASTIEAEFQDGRFQGAEFYQPDQGEPFILASIGGKIYRVNVWTMPTVAQLTIPGQWNSSVLPKAWFCQAENFMVIQDNQSRPIFFDGTNLSRSVPGQVPVGNVMAYGNGRIWTTLPNRSSFVGGDIVYGDGTRANVLEMKENDFLVTAGVFAVPSNLGGITGMKFMASIDSSLGQGPLQVFTSSSIFSVNAPVDRTIWKELRYPIQTISQLTNGALSDRCIVSVNSDIFYRSLNGASSFMLSRRDFSRWKDKPISREVNRVLRKDGRTWLQYCSGQVFDNRFLMTTIPENVQDRGTAFKAMAVMDLDPLSSLIEDQPPIWEGIWTSLRILQLVKGFYEGEERLFAFVLNALNHIEVWEITRDANFDNRTDRIQWSFETRSMAFGDPMDESRIAFHDSYWDDIRGKVDFRTLFRPDQYPCWFEWEEWTECATNEICQPDDGSECITIKNLQPQYRSRHRSNLPEFQVDDSSDRPARVGDEFQMRMEVTGCARLLKLGVWSEEMQEETASSRDRS